MYKALTCEAGEETEILTSSTGIGDQPARGSKKVENCLCWVDVDRLEVI